MHQYAPCNTAIYDSELRLIHGHKSDTSTISQEEAVVSDSPWDTHTHLTRMAHILERKTASR